MRMSRTDLRLEEQDKMAFEAYVERKRLYSLSNFLRTAGFSYMRRNKVRIVVPENEKEAALKRFYERSG